MTDPEGTPARIATVSVKLPPFWPADPQLWFAQVEAQFSTRNITTQKTKFEYVVASLSPEYATEVRDLLLRPPNENPYDVLKEQLVKQTAASEQRRLQQLLSSEELGDRKPTQLLRRMQQLLGDTPRLPDEAFVRELFLQRLPSNVRMVLASTRQDTSLEELAQMADKIVEVATPSVSAVNNIPSSIPPQIATEMEQLRSEVASLTSLVKSITQHRRSPSPNFRRRQSPSRSSTDLCWYHQRYGDFARKCIEPCSKSGNAMASR